MMLKTIKIIPFAGGILTATLVATGCATQNVYYSRPRVDGSTGSKHGFYNSDSKLVYSLEHDADNIYLHAYTAEPTTQMKMICAGFTVWFDPMGKKNTDIGITYPVKPQDGQPAMSMGDMPAKGEDARGMMAPQDGDRTAEMMRQFAKHGADRAELLGIGGVVRRPMHTSEFASLGIVVKLRTDTLGTLHYSLTMPRKLMYAGGQADNGAFAIGFSSGTLDMPSGPPRGMGQPPQGGGPRGGGMGGGPNGSGPGGGGMGGGPRGGPGPDGMDDPATKAIAIWFVANLNGDPQNQN